MVRLVILDQNGKHLTPQDVPTAKELLTPPEGEAPAEPSSQAATLEFECYLIWYPNLAFQKLQHREKFIPS